MPPLYRKFDLQKNKISAADSISIPQLEEIAVEIGILLLESGAEIFRVEDTVLRILKAYGSTDCEVYVLSNGIFASTFDSKKQSACIIKHAATPIIHLNRITLLNQLARDICAHKCSPEEMRRRLDICRNTPFYPDWLCLLSCGIGTGSFCYLFGGSPLDCLCSFLIGIFEQRILFLFERRHMPLMLSYVFTSSYITLTSILLGLLRLPVQPDCIVIGSIMPLVPGITLTTSIHDFYNSDYLSGTIHMIDALLAALCIAVGVCISIFACNTLSKGTLIP